MCRRTHIRLPARVLFAAFLGGAALATGEDVRLGDVKERVLSVRGNPTREIRTSAGSILFYGSLLINIENGEVVFMSQANPAVVARAKSHTPAASPAMARVARAVPPPRTWIEDGMENREKVLTERMKRFLAFESYGEMIKRITWQDYYDGRHISYRGRGDVHGGAEGFQSGCHRNADGDADGVNLLELKDAQSVSLTAYGVDSRLRDRYVAVRQTVGVLRTGEPE